MARATKVPLASTAHVPVAGAPSAQRDAHVGALATRPTSAHGAVGLASHSRDATIHFWSGARASATRDHGGNTPSDGALARAQRGGAIPGAEMQLHSSRSHHTGRGMQLPAFPARYQRNIAKRKESRSADQYINWAQQPHPKRDRLTQNEFAPYEPPSNKEKGRGADEDGVNLCSSDDDADHQRAEVKKAARAEENKTAPDTFPCGQRQIGDIWKYAFPKDAPQAHQTLDSKKPSAVVSCIC